MTVGRHRHSFRGRDRCDCGAPRLAPRGEPRCPVCSVAIPAGVFACDPCKARLEAEADATPATPDEAKETL